MNDIKKTGDELIAMERERQVLVKGHTIMTDALKYKNGELLMVANALISKNINDAPHDWPDEQVKEWIEKDDTERLILAGAFIAAQIDVYNFMQQVNESMKYARENHQPEEN